MVWLFAKGTADTGCMSPQRLSGLEIIVVEDHDEARTAIDSFLDRLGATVVVLKDGREGLKAVKSNHPHLADRSSHQRRDFPLKEGLCPTFLYFAR